MEFPAEACPPEETDGWLVVLHFCGIHQGGQDHPRLCAIDHVMIVVLEASADSICPERGRNRTC